MKKFVSAVISLVMSIAMFAMPASAGWLDPWPTEEEVRTLAYRDTIDKSELDALASKYQPDDFWNICDTAIADDMIAIATMKENRPDRDNAQLSQIYLRYVDLYCAIYPSDPGHYSPDHNSYAMNALKGVTAYNNDLVDVFGTTMAKKSLYSSTNYNFTVDGLEAETEYNKMYRCHFNDGPYEGESFLVNTRDAQRLTVGKAYTNQFLAFINLGNSLDSMEDVGYMPGDDLSEMDLGILQERAYRGFEVYHDSNFNLFMKYVVGVGDYTNLMWS